MTLAQGRVMSKEIRAIIEAIGYETVSVNGVDGKSNILGIVVARDNNGFKVISDILQYMAVNSYHEYDEYFKNLSNLVEEFSEFIVGAKVAFDEQFGRVLVFPTQVGIRNL